MTGRALGPGSGEVTGRGGIGLRLLKCDTCRAVWPTERSEADGGSRADGEPCAYRWPTGKICEGHVHALGYVAPPPPFAGEDTRHAPPPARAAYAGRWCEVLGVPWGTTDLALVRRRYREAVKVAHPDAGGTHAAMIALNEAYREALAELAQPGAPRSAT